MTLVTSGSKLVRSWCFCCIIPRLFLVSSCFDPEDFRYKQNRGHDVLLAGLHLTPKVPNPRLDYSWCGVGRDR